MASSAQLLLTARRGTVVGLNSILKALIVTGLGVSARLLGGTTCTLIKDVVLINGVLLVAL